MSDIPSNTDQLDEQLTAYLDGELPPAEARRVEDMLAGDERAQKRLNQLASSWDLLEQLPRAAVGEDFARTTVEMVALSTEDEIAKIKAAEPSQRRLRWIAAAAIALLAAGVGFAAVSVATPNDNEALLRDLPVVVNLEAYRPVGKIELLQELNKSNIFVTDPPGFRGRPGPSSGDRSESRKEPRAEGRGELDKAIVTVPSSLENRRAWISSKLTAEEKLELRRSFERFSALSPQEQSELRRLDEQLTTAPDRDQLVRIIQRYNDWLRMLSLAERGALEDLSPEKKVVWIEQRKHDRDAWAVMMIRGFQDYARHNEAKLLAQMPAESKLMLDKLKQDEERNPRGPSRYYGRLAFEAWRDPNVKLPATSSQELRPIVEQIVERLPPDSQLKKQLSEKTAAASPVEILRDSIQSGALMREFSQRMGPRWGQGRRWNQERLQQFEANLTAEEKEKLNGLSGPKKQEAFLKIFREKFGGDRPGRFGGDYSGRGPGEGPPPDGMLRDGPPPDGQRPVGPRRGEWNRRGEGKRGDGGRGENGTNENSRGNRNGPRGRPPEAAPDEPSDRPLPPPSKAEAPAADKPEANSD